MSSNTHISPSQDTGGNVNYLPSSCNISDISMISVYWSDIINKPGFCNISITGSYNDLLNVPSLSAVAFSGDYNSLSNRPWINSNSNIYNNNQGNIGIGTNNPTEKLHLVGNFSIAGNIIPAINSNFNLGSSDYKWKDLYLSGNSIYLDNLVISRNSSNNLEIRDSNNNLRSISLNQLELNDGNNKLRFQYSNGGLIFNSNDVTIRGIEFSNYPNIIYSNNLYSTSNSIIDYTNYRINNLSFNTGGATSININTDTIQIGTSNNFITSNTYGSNITFTNNLNVNGSYQLNNCNIPFSLMKYTNITTTDGVFSYISSSNDFGYFSFVSSGTINFPQTTSCDVLVVGAGGNGGTGSFSGGGGAGEIIAYPSYSFPAGSYTIQVGTSGTSSNNRISKITSNSIDLLNAKGGADGISLGSITCNTTSNLLNYGNGNSSIIAEYNYSNLLILPAGNSNFLFTGDGSIVTNSRDIYSSVSGVNPSVWYKFDNNTNLGLDEYGNQNLTNNLTVLPTTNSIKGTFAAQFSTTTNNYLSKTSSTPAINGVNFTISFWFMLFSNARMGIFTIGSSSTTRAKTGVQVLSTAALYIKNYGDDYSAIYSFNLNTFYHFTMTFNTSSPYTQKIYINGILIKQYNLAGTIVTNTSQFDIGRWNESGVTYYFNGIIDDFRIYNGIEFSASQVAELFASSVNRTYPILKNSLNQNLNPLLWLKFDDNTNVGKDDMGVYNYSINNNVSTYSTYPAKGNSSASFNGTSSYLATSAGVNLNNKSFSISLWIYPIALSTTTNTIVLMRDITTNNAATNNRLQIFFTPSGGNQYLLFGYYANDTSVIVNNGDFSDKWSHIVGTYNFSTQIRTLYANGVAIKTNTSVAALNEPDQRHLFGADKSTVSSISSYFNGYMDDIRFYDFELSLAQIQELYQGRIRFYNVNSNNIGGSGGGSYANVNQTSSIGTKWDSNYSYLSSGYIGTSNQGGNGGGAASNIGLTTSLVTGSSLIVGEGGTGATLNSTPVLKTTYGSGGDGNGGTGMNGLVIVKVPLNTCNVKFDGFIYSSNIFDLNYNTITLMSLASNQLNSSIIATSNRLIDYDNLIDKPWINSNLIIYNNNQGNVGIGTNNPTSKLDVSGDINFTGTLRLNQRSLPFSVYSNTNILTSNGLFSYIPNNVFFGYYTFLTGGSITFPQTTLCDIIVVGAGGNGGTGILSGGGGAGEVIAYPNYSFTTGTYGIQVGTTNDIASSNLRRSIITSNNTNLVTANGGGDGAYNFFGISGTGSVFSSNVIGSTTDYYITFTSGSTTITLNQNLVIDILVIGGGGGGSSRDGGGGGAGALIYKTNYTLVSGVYTIAIGAGGAGASGLFLSGAGFPSNYGGNNGSDTTITNSSGTIIFRAKGGGGGGGGTNNDGTGRVGGCNGANLAANTTAQQPVSTQNIPQDADVFGNKGGVSATTSPNPWGTPGGGGTGGVGLSQTMSGSTIIKGGDGGIGKQIPITGSNLYYGGGGGGGCFGSSTVTTPTGDGGLGGGGKGSRTGLGTKADNGIANTGGGGGGGGFGPNPRTNGNDDNSAGGDGGSGVVIIRYSLSNLVTAASSGGSGGGGLSSSFSNMIVLSNAAVPGAKWNPSYSYSTSGSNGTLTSGGNGGSALSNIGYTETITSNSFILGVGGIGATSNSVPSLKTTYGSGGDGNGGLGTQGIVIIKVPLNIQRPRFDGYINYSNIDNRPVLNDLLTSTNYLNIGYYNQVNFPLGDVSWNNEWFLYIGRSPTNVLNSFIFWHLTSNINSKWWFNGTQTSTNNEISDARIKKEITEIQNPLDKLMLIQPKQYYLCDEKDYLKKYGVIAQDVASNQELSHLVYKDEDYIANVYITATYVSSPKFLLITTTSIIDKIAVDDELKLLLDNMNIENIEIIIEETPYHNRYKKRYVKVKEIIDEFTIEIYEEIEVTENEKSNILIYGKKVNDFNKLDYSSLYSLNIACTQELYKIIQEQKNKIDQLEQRIIQLENR